MAISRGSGTEIIRTALFEDVVGVGSRDLIIGVQHHIYTVLSVIMYTVNAGGYVDFQILGYDSYGGTTQENIVIFSRTVVAAETFVWNDKFSFNGCEPTNFTGPLSTVAEQDLIADQAESAITQNLQLYVSHANVDVDIVLTYIDQNNS